MADLDKCKTIASFIPIIRDLQAKVLDVENALEATAGLFLSLQAALDRMRDKIAVPDDQEIKQASTKKSYAETAVRSTVPVKPTIKPPAKATKTSAHTAKAAEPTKIVKRQLKKPLKPVKVEKKQVEEPWKTVRGSRYLEGESYNGVLAPLLIDAKCGKILKKDFCINGLPANISEEDLTEIIQNIVSLVPCHFVNNPEDLEEERK